MPLVAECVFCGGKVRVPDAAIGLSVTCPQCGDAFTLASGSNRPIGGSPRRVSDLINQPNESEALVTATPTVLGASFRPVQMLPGLSFLLGSLALLASSMASGHGLPLILIAAGFLGGGLGFFRAQRRTLSVVALAVNGAALLSIFLLPQLLPYLPASTELDRDPFAGKVCRITTGYSRTIPVREVPVILDASDWVDTDRYALQHDYVRLRVLSVAVAAVPFKDRRARKESGLLIGIRLYHVGSHRQIHYESWNQCPLIAYDEAGRAYPLRAYESTSGVQGTARSAELQPMESVSDLLVFEPPRQPWTRLRLELPASAYGSSGTLHLEIPVEMLRKSPKRLTVSK